MCGLGLRHIKILNGKMPFIEQTNYISNHIHVIIDGSVCSVQTAAFVDESMITIAMVDTDLYQV